MTGDTSGVRSQQGVTQPVLGHFPVTEARFSTISSSSSSKQATLCVQEPLFARQKGPE
jgi:hypothetical protein